MTAQALPDNAVLENAIWESMTGAHAHLTEGTGRARRYFPTIAPFVGINDIDDPRTWIELAQLVGPGQDVAVARDVENLPDGWTVVIRTDSAGGTHDFLDHLHKRRLAYSVGCGLTATSAAIIDTHAPGPGAGGLREAPPCSQSRLPVSSKNALDGLLLTALRPAR